VRKIRRYIRYSYLIYDYGPARISVKDKLLGPGLGLVKLNVLLLFALTLIVTILETGLIVIPPPVNCTKPNGKL